MKYTREIAEEVIKDLNGYNNGFEVLYSTDVEFLDSKFPKLPETGLLVHENGSLVFRTGKESGYGFGFIRGVFKNEGNLSFIKSPEIWKPATPKDLERFRMLVLKELKSRGIEEGTEFESLVYSNIYTFRDRDLNVHTDSISIGGIYVYFNGKWIEPIKKDVLKDDVSALESVIYITLSKDSVVTIKNI